MGDGQPELAKVGSGDGGNAMRKKAQSHGLYSSKHDLSRSKVSAGLVRANLLTQSEEILEGVLTVLCSIGTCTATYLVCLISSLRTPDKNEARVNPCIRGLQRSTACFIYTQAETAYIRI